MDECTEVQMPIPFVRGFTFSHISSFAPPIALNVCIGLPTSIWTVNSSLSPQQDAFRKSLLTFLLHMAHLLPFEVCSMRILWLDLRLLTMIFWYVRTKSIPSLDHHVCGKVSYFPFLMSLGTCQQLYCSYFHIRNSSNHGLLATPLFEYFTLALFVMQF